MGGVNAQLNAICNFPSIIILNLCLARTGIKFIILYIYIYIFNCDQPRGLVVRVSDY
jgi:hypothetical protein